MIDVRALTAAVAPVPRLTSTSPLGVGKDVALCARAVAAVAMVIERIS